MACGIIGTMCGRFTLRDPAILAERFQAQLDVEGELPARFNIAPTQTVPIVVDDPAGRRIQLARWGLIPSWAKDPGVGARLINARAETLAEKPSFRAALRSRRCLVPADGFFEWQKVAGRSTPFFIHRRDHGLFAFAGLYEHWRDPSGQSITSCTIITTEPNATLAAGGPGGSRIHDRMPAILPPEDEGQWLDPAAGETDHWRQLLRPYPAEWLEVYAVAPLVNRPGNDTPALVARV